MTDARKYPSSIIAIVVVALGFVAAYSVRWYCDDIFITLRYADQFLAGNGFVYNAGERVEGYTHFLWLLLLTAVRAAGVDPVGAAVGVGLAAYLGTILVFLLISHRMGRPGGRVVIPFTALALVANYECNVWATSGLETFFFTLLLSLAFFAYFFTRARRSLRTVLSATFLILATMTRPDGALLYALAGLFVAVAALRRGNGPAGALREVTLYALPLVVIYAPYVVWKVDYYGDFFPNTYYAKSAGLPYYSQGFFYLWLYLRAHPTSILFVLSIPVLVAAFAAGERGRKREETRVTNAALVALAGVVVYLVFFVARVGGDFMYARFVVPMLPFLYWLIEWSLRRMLGRRRLVRAAVFVLLALMIATVERGLREQLLFEDKDGTVALRTHRGVIDEHYYYRKAYPIEREREFGEALRPYFDGLDVTVLLRGQACLAYYAGFRTCIEASGLTDVFIAHLPLEKRGRIGHEKIPPYHYLLERGVNFVFERKPYRNRSYRIVALKVEEEPTGGEIITYDAALMHELARRLRGRIRFQPFEEILDAYIENELDTRALDAVRRDYEEFREYYFAHNDDPGRERPFLERLGAGE